jgi:ParB-like chromosome segregation protein Spo0J
VAEVQEVELPLSQIELDPDNVRTEYDPDIVAGLRTALEAEGAYINPPSVYPIGRKRYRVKHGSTRVLAAKGLLSSMRVRIVDPPQNESSKVLSQMGENLLQGSLRPADIGHALKRLREADGRERSLSQLVGALKAAGINRTKAWVVMHLALAELNGQVQRLVNQGKLGAEVAYQLRNLPHREQVGWSLRIVDEGITLADLRRQLGSLSQPDDDTELSAGRVQREVSDRLSGAAQDFERKPSGTARDTAHRSTRAVSRWELLPVGFAADNAPSDQWIEPEQWSRHASETDRQLAQEALLVGGYSPAEAIDLVERATREAPQATESIMAALNALRVLVESPADVAAGSGLAEFLALRMRRVLANLGRA